MQIVKQKIKDGAGVNQRASDGSLPLCTAAFWGYADIVDLLLENKYANLHTNTPPPHPPSSYAHLPRPIVN